MGPSLGQGKGERHKCVCVCCLLVPSKIEPVIVFVWQSMYKVMDGFNWFGDLKCFLPVKCRRVGAETMSGATWQTASQVMSLCEIVFKYTVWFGKMSNPTAFQAADVPQAWTVNLILIYVCCALLLSNNGMQAPATCKQIYVPPKYVIQRHTRALCLTSPAVVNGLHLSRFFWYTLCVY